MRKISPRLLAVSEEIEKRGFQDIVYDIGTDHAYLPIHLLQSGICGAVAVSDISYRSLDRAKRNVAAGGVAGGVRFYAGDGFLSIPDYIPGRIVIIAGIGGINLINILKKGADKARAASLLVLQPMSGQEELREWLYNNTFAIEYERLAREGNRVYNILFCRAADAQEPYAPADVYIGNRVAYVSREDYIFFLRFTRKKISNRLNGLNAAKTACRGIGANTVAEINRLAGVVYEIDKRITEV